VSPTGESALVARTAALACEAQPEIELELDRGALAGVDCDLSDAALGPLTLIDFTDQDSLRDYWQAELDILAPSLEEVETACKDAEPGLRKWGFGSIACIVVGDIAQVRWTDQRTQTIGVVEGVDGDIAPLYDWWRTTARPLGRSTEAEGDDAEPTPAKAPPLVRVPGPPRAISCEAVSEPIPDEWGRTWRITTVDFLERGNYERIVLNLERTGKNRSNKPTVATLERMPVSKVTGAVPGATRPKRGRTAFVIQLAGVREAPNLRGYRPSSTELVRELSIVRGSGSRTVIISGPRDTCYQMRVPVWGPSASGKEVRAEIYIDLKEKPNP
jgi:hypothetical protein